MCLIFVCLFVRLAIRLLGCVFVRLFVCWFVCFCLALSLVLLYCVPHNFVTLREVLPPTLLFRQLFASFLGIPL